MTAHMRVSLLQTTCMCGLLVATSASSALAGSVSSSQSTSLVPKVRIVEAYENLPLSFEANRGQTDEKVKFLSRGSDHGLYLTKDEAVLTICKAFSDATRQHSRRSMGRPPVCGVVRMQLARADSKTNLVGEAPLPGTVNYFIGQDPAKWRSSIPIFARVRYHDIYPGIDLVYYGNQHQVEFDFVVAAHADPQLIRLRLAGASKAHLTTSGDAVVTTDIGNLALHKPVIYQTVHGHRRQVAGEFTLLGGHTLGFRLGNYDRARELVIDPVLEYSTFLSGSGNPSFALLGNSGTAIAVDSEGNAYITGEVLSTDFPVTAGAFQTTDPGGQSETPTAFVTKLNAAGTALVYSTYLGGSNWDQASAIAVDAAGDAYIAGQTASTNFPVTAGAFQTADVSAEGQPITGFVTELNPSGTDLVYSTYLGGSGVDGATAIAVNTAGEAYVVGQTSSSNFPVTPGAYQTTNKAAATLPNAFVVKLNSAGTALIYGTYLGGSGGPPMPEGGCLSAMAAPNDILGWALGDNEDGAFAVAVDAAGDAYVAGQALSADFPVTGGALQTQNKGATSSSTNAFVAKLNPAGSALIYSTYLGGSGLHSCGSETATASAGDAVLALAVDGSGNAYVAGVTFSSDFPVTEGAFQTTNRCSLSVNTLNGPLVGGPTGFLAKLNPSGAALVYSTYLGGSGGFINFLPFFAQYGGDQASGLAIDSSGNAYVTGSTASPNFPVTPGAFQTMNNYVVSTGECGTSCPRGTNGYNAFLTEMNSAGNALVYSTYLGGNGGNSNVENGVTVIGTGDVASALARDDFGNVYITGQVESANFPVTNGAFQTTIPAFQSAFVAQLNIGPRFTTTATPVTINAGATSGNTSTITVTPANGFTGSVALTASITSGPGGEDPPTFSFGSTSPVNITGPSAGMATLTVNTTAAVVCSQAGLSTHGLPWSSGGAVLASVVFLGTLNRRRIRRSIVPVLLLLVTMAGGFLACGGSGGSSCSGSNGTTPGTYIVSVTGSSGTTTAQGTVTLIVQ